MKKKLFYAASVVLMVLFAASCSFYDFDDVFQSKRGKNKSPDEITFVQENLFPEGIEYDKRLNRFLVSSITYGSIGQVLDDGTYKKLIDDNDLISTIGIHIDQPRKRLLVAVADLGLSVKSSEATIGTLAALAAYDLYSGQRIFYADLGSLRPGMGHFANDVTVDNQGNAYVTDSFAGIIYKVDQQGKGSIFYENDALAPEPGNFGLNGIDYDPRGYLLVTRSDAGQLLRFPVNEPAAYSIVNLPVSLAIPDGVYLKSPNELVVVSNAFGADNGTVHTFRTWNQWESASLVAEFITPEVFPTTVTIRDGSPYVLYAYLHLLLAGETVSEFKIVKAESKNVQ
jgi:sugar lactone lactonase YvrE